MTFFERLEARCRAVDSLLCVGLDPHRSELAEPSATGAVSFCLRIIAATAPFAAAFKPNAAFFEAFGAEGVEALRTVIAAVPDGIPVILDAKRGDIGSTSEAYATAAFERLGADAITLSPYLGGDGIAPFLADERRGAFVLCRTSNAGGADLQDLRLASGERIFERVAELATSWGAQVGLVVGATRPDELAAVRARVPEAWVLAPGVGAQGGDLVATVHAGVRADGLGLLVNVSRAISRAPDPALAAEVLVRDLREARASRRPAARLDPVAAGLLRAGCVKLGSFKLKSGLMSPIYLDLRRLIADPPLLHDVASAYGRLLADLPHDVIAPLPYAAMPIGTAVSLQTGTPMVYPRREAKDYGTKASVEGVFEAGQTAVVLDDLATTGGSKVEGIEKLTAVGLKVTDVVVLIDRESGAREAMADIGVRLHAVYTLTGLLEAWEAAGAIRPEQADEVRAFLQASRT